LVGDIDRATFIWVIYALWFILVIFLIVTAGAWNFLLVVLGALFLWRVGAEDKLMAQQFPNEYPDYKRGTKALIPFVW
jgi:protein-S-isoprenylcysteine O-methyltransferase Ste14